MSLAMEVARLAAEQVDREALPRVSAVGVEVGDRAGVVVDALEFCLEAVLTEPPFDGARPVVERCRGDVLRLAWIDVAEDGDGRVGDGRSDDGGARDRDRAAAGAGRRPGGDGPSPLGDAPLPSEGGPPPGAGDGSRADSNDEGKGVR